jgi:hypothetical protein
MKTGAPRYALYYAPHPDSPWGRFGSDWTGRCAFYGGTCTQRAPAGFDAGTFARLTAGPRRYGFHATLKPPFRLAQGRSLDSLTRALREACRQEEGFELPPLKVRELDGFLALVAEPMHEGSARIERLAARMVDARERELLERWGYPWVLDRFRFHFSLTGPLRGEQPSDIDRLREAAATRLPRDPLRFDAVCVFEESTPGAPLRAIRRCALS